MRDLVLLFFSLFISIAQAAMIYPGQTTDITFEPTASEYGLTWTTDNPTLQLSSVGFLCHVTAQAYFGGTATVTCTYKDQIGLSVSTRTRKWSFTCADTRISVSPTTKNVKVGEFFQLSWSFGNATYINPSIQFTGYDSNVVSVTSDGVVTAKSEGSTQIFVKSNIGTNSAICSVNVNSQSSAASGSSSSYDEWDSTNSRVIKLEQAGTLSDFIPQSEKYTITNLTIVGPVNGADLRLLRDMAGADYDKKTTAGKLEVLDLKEAIFVSGGPWYIQNDNYGSFYYTEDNANFPKYAFFMCPSLKKIRLPKYCISNLSQALNYCKNLEIICVSPGTSALSFYEGYSTPPLSFIVLPSSIEGFYPEFKGLTNIQCYSTTPPSVNKSRFLSQTNIKNGILYVPKGCAQAYWRADGWREFKDIKETLEVCNTLSICVGENGVVRYGGVEIKQNYGISYSGYQAFEVPADLVVNIELIPDDGYSVSQIFVNDQPQTLTDDGKLSIGKLSSHTKISVYFGEEASIEDILGNAANMTWTVYNLQGLIIKDNVTMEEVNMLPNGLFIIRSGARVHKIVRR